MKFESPFIFTIGHSTRKPDELIEILKGVGVTEATRGALAHFIDIGEKGLIRNYEMIVPTTWNISPMDDKNRHGALESMLLNTTVKDAEKIADNIRIEFSKIIFNTPTESFSKTLSIGIANYPDDSSNVEEVLKFADLALYNAKESGRDRVIIYHPKMNEENNN